MRLENLMTLSWFGTALVRHTTLTVFTLLSRVGRVPPTIGEGFTTPGSQLYTVFEERGR